MWKKLKNALIKILFTEEGYKQFQREMQDMKKPGKDEAKTEEEGEIYGTELKELRDLLRRQRGILYCLQCNSKVRINLKDIESEIRRNREIASRFPERASLFVPDLSHGAVCKTCKGVFCGKCAQEALRRKGEFREQLIPLIRKYALQQAGFGALLNPEAFEESLERSLELCLSPSDHSTVLCLRCKQDLLVGLDHITD